MGGDIPVGFGRFGAKVRVPGEEDEGDLMFGRHITMEEPSATIVIRTHGDPDVAPQLNYFPPHLAFVELERGPVDELGERKLQVLETVHEVDPGNYAETAIKILQNSDPNIGFRVLYHALSVGIESSNIKRISETAREIHGDWIEVAMISLEEKVRASHVVTSRTEIRNPEQRYLLAILASYIDRKGILELMTQRFPETDPIEKIMELVPEMSGLDRVGIDFDEVNMDIFRLLLEGTPDEQVPMKLEEIYDSKEIEDQKEELKSHIQKMKASPVFKPLFG